MKQINAEKLRAAIRQLNDRRTGVLKDRPIVGKNYHEVLAWEKACSVERANQLYSLSAEIHGNLHMTKQWVPNNLADGYQVLVERTHEDQLKMIEPIVDEFALTEEELAAREAKRQERLKKMAEHGNGPQGTTHADQIKELMARDGYVRID